MSENKNGGFSGIDDDAGDEAQNLLNNFENIPEKSRNDILLRLSEKEEAEIFIIKILIDHFDRLPEDLRNEILLKFSKKDMFVSRVEQIVSTNFEKIPVDIRNKISENIRNMSPFQTKSRTPFLMKSKPQLKEKPTERLVRFERSKELRNAKEWGSNKGGGAANSKSITDKKTKYLRQGYASIPKRTEESKVHAAPPPAMSTEEIAKAAGLREFDMEEKNVRAPVEMKIDLRKPITEIPHAENPTRYADFTFFYDEGGNQGPEVPKKHTLQTYLWYQLEVAVRVKTKGLPFKGKDKEPIGEPGQEQNVTIMVTAHAENENFIFIENPVQTLSLPPHGDSINNAIFRVRPVDESRSKDDIAQITVRLYYEFNLLEVVTINSEVVGSSNDPTQSRYGRDIPIWFEQERRELGYEYFDSIMPRDMHIDIRKKGEDFVFTFALYKSPDQKIVLTAPATLTATGLDTDLKEIREIWYKIAMSERFKDNLEGNSSYNNMVRGLAICGSKLWTGLFMRDSNSSIFKIGEWLKDHPVNIGGLIHVSIQADAANFVFPWALLYDKELKDNELPDICGFWGMRYRIEQQLPGITKTIDKPFQVADRLKIGFMLVNNFPNQSEEISMMESFEKRSSGKLDITTPITDNDDCYNLLTKCDAHILYFYTHGYTKYKKEIGAGNDMEIFKTFYDSVDKNSKLYERLSTLNDRIKREQNDFKPKDSWIELTNGRLYLADLYRRITSGFDTGPLVILNMCESAQIIPSLSDSFIHFFINRGAKSVIGTECPMTVEFAHPFAEKFLEGILKGEEIGAVLLKARRHFMELRNPLGLAYTLFGSATARFEPAVLQ